MGDKIISKYSKENRKNVRLNISKKTQLLIAGMAISAIYFFFLPMKIPRPLEVKPNEDRNECVVSEVPSNFGFDPFYKKFCDMDGIPIISSQVVSDHALQQAYYIVKNMLLAIPYVKDEFVESGIYIAIIGKNENQTTLPEYSHMDSEYWDNRARGLGASGKVKITSVGEENLLCLNSDRYQGENILVHEFAHTIHLMGLRKTIFGFEARLRLLYYVGKFEGLWRETYAGSNIKEYWAEGIQTYFRTNIEKQNPDGIHNSVNTPEELAEYDPRLYKFIDGIYGGFNWTPTCPSE